MATATGVAEAPLCDYELQRLERIKRNRKARRRCSRRVYIAASRLHAR
jgi:hypothetical protein